MPRSVDLCFIFKKPVENQPPTHNLTKMVKKRQKTAVYTILRRWYKFLSFFFQYYENLDILEYQRRYPQKFIWWYRQKLIFLKNPIEFCPIWGDLAKFCVGGWLFTYDMNIKKKAGTILQLFIFRSDDFT